MPKRLGGRVDRGVDLFLVRYVGRHGDRLLLAAEFGRRGFRGVQIEVGDSHAPAGLDETLGYAMADAARGAGDERDLAIKFH